MINFFANLIDKMPTAQKGKGKPKAVFYPSLQQKATVVWTWQKCFSTDLNFLSPQTFIISHVQHLPKYKKYNNGHLKVSSRNQRAAWHLRKQECVPSTRNTQGRNSTGLRRTGALCWVIFLKKKKTQSAKVYGNNKNTERDRVKKVEAASWDLITGHSKCF